MRLRGVVVLAVIAASACGGDEGSGPGPGDYFTQVARVSETAHIQERGLQRELRVRLEEARRGEDRFSALLVYVDQSARLYEDVVDALGALEPADSVGGPHDAYIEAWQAQLDLMITVRDAGFEGPNHVLDALDEQVIVDAAAQTRATCQELQAAVAAAGQDVDLVCDGRPD